MLLLLLRYHNGIYVNEQQYVNIINKIRTKHSCVI